MSIVLSPDTGIATPSPVVLEGSSSGTITLAAPAAAGSTTITFPATTGTVALTSGVIGAGQTWQNLTSSRAIGTTYTNSTGRPIMVAVSLSSGAAASANATFVIDGSTVANNLASYSNGATWANLRQTFSFIIPAGSTYSATVSSSPALQSWYELR